ncbi:MAG: HAMP domain-containing protein [Acidobacteriaceae bacterium]|nr:HAMP domain-containing protein [Acidobacteriaceae bacterium]MBV9781444.1 HAMP domain-containing protein [Acidobacteriaceae bacterium]
MIGKIPLRWRVFLATSITITILFAVAGWGLQRYALSVADQSIRQEIRGSIQAYDAVWKARTQMLSATSALMSSMSDVRKVLMTRDQTTIHDFAQDLWSRVSNESAVFLVLRGDGSLICALGKNGEQLSPAEIPLQQISSRFPRQQAGYLREGSRLFYIVLTPVYVQTTGQPLLLNVLCAGFRIDDHLANELRQLAPGSDFAFLGEGKVFASTLGPGLKRSLAEEPAQDALSQYERIQRNQFIALSHRLADVTGKPIAELRILHSSANLERSLSELRRSLGLAWLATIALAILLTSFITNRLLQPVSLLDRAAAEIASRNYRYRLPVQGTDELSRLAETFNHMCDSIEQARADLIHQEQIHTIGRLASSLVHDLRNPLAAVYGGAEMLVDGQLPPEQTGRIASNIYRASHRIQELLQDLLNVSRGEASNLERCHLKEIVESAADSVHATSDRVRVRIAIDDAMELFVNRTRLERVFVNLFSNAIDAMPEGGDVFVYQMSETDKLKVFVEDTGPGVPLDLRPQLFRPFVTAGKRTGLGLGLSLSRQTMLDIGGDLQLVEKSGPGACFCLEFGASSLVSSKEEMYPAASAKA